MTSSRSPKVYDIQGKPIKEGYLVAFAYHGALLTERVAAIGVTGWLLLESGMTSSPAFSVVLEEPVWPNTR